MEISEISKLINSEVYGVWFLIGAALVFWMQAGFAMCEAGFTRAKNSGEKYRGAEVDATLLPKVKVEVVIGNLPLDQVIETARKTLYTGKIGDGKIFVYNVAKVIKVRTGEKNMEALKDVE